MLDILFYILPNNFAHIIVFIFWNILNVMTANKTVESTYPITRFNASNLHNQLNKLNIFYWLFLEKLAWYIAIISRVWTVYVSQNRDYFQTLSIMNVCLSVCLCHFNGAMKGLLRNTSNYKVSTFSHCKSWNYISCHGNQCKNQINI